MNTRAMTLDAALDDYRRVRRGRYEAETWRAHEQRLYHWRRWLVNELRPGKTGIYLDTIADSDGRYMERYFNTLRPPRYAAGSFNNYRQILVLFWKYCRAEGWALVDPMRHIDPVQVPVRVRLQLSAAELLAMLDDATARDRAALALGMNTGLRAGDVAALKIGSANLTNNRLTAWIKKTNTEEILPITAELRLELIRWFKAYAAKMGVEDWRSLPNNWTLVPPVVDHPVNPNDFSLGREFHYRPLGQVTKPYTIVQKALEARGYETKGEGFHTLRRSAALALHEFAKAMGETDPIARPQALLGHKQRATTERYIGVTVAKDQLDKMLRGQSFLGHAAQLDAAAVKDQNDEGRFGGPAVRSA